MMGLSHLFRTDEATFGVLCAVLVSSVQERCEHTAVAYSEGSQRWLRTWSICHTIIGWENWGCLDWRIKGSGSRRDLFNVYKYLMGWCKEGARLPSVLHSQRKGSNGHKWKHRKFHLNVRGFFVFQLWEWLNAGKGCPERLWSLHLGEIQDQTGYGPKQSALANPALSREVWIDDVQRSLSTTAILWFVPP